MAEIADEMLAQAKRRPAVFLIQDVGIQRQRSLRVTVTKASLACLHWNSLFVHHRGVEMTEGMQSASFDAERVEERVQLPVYEVPAVQRLPTLRGKQKILRVRQPQ